MCELPCCVCPESKGHFTLFVSLKKMMVSLLIMLLIPPPTAKALVMTFIMLIARFYLLCKRIPSYSSNVSKLVPLIIFVLALLFAVPLKHTHSELKHEYLYQVFWRCPLVETKPCLYLAAHLLL